MGGDIRVESEAGKGSCFSLLYYNSSQSRPETRRHIGIPVELGQTESTGR